MLCRHCQVKNANRPLGLCWTCYYKPGVRALYPSTSKYAPKRHGSAHREPTEAELDAIIAEQMKCLPAWWNKEPGR